MALAEVLQYGHHQKFAELISRHERSLCELNRIATVAKRPASGGREWTEYWLTESQCLYLTAKSETDVAKATTDLRHV